MSEQSSPLQSLTDLQRCVQMVIDSQPEVVRYSLKMLWEAANTDPLEDWINERTWMNHRRFLAMLADHHDFFKPVLSSLPDTGTAVYGLLWGELTHPSLEPYLQEWNALENALRDLLPEQQTL